MSAACHDHQEPVYAGDNPAFRRALWVVIAINGAMFVIEVIARLSAASMALQADALGFLGDCTTYGLSLFVLPKPPSWRGCPVQRRNAGGSCPLGPACHHLTGANDRYSGSHDYG